MALKVMADNGELISAAQDGALYDVLANRGRFVIDGIGNNMTVGQNSTSLNVTLATGECVIRGRHITNTAPITLQLSPNTTGTLVLRFNSSNNTASFMTTSSVTNGNVNNASTTADLVLGEYTTSASGVSTYTDKRTVKQGIYGTASSSSAGLMSAADKSKLDGIAAGRQVNTVTGVKGSSESSYRTGNVNITKANLGLGNVENYSLAQIKSNITKSDVGLGNVDNKSSATIRSEITSANVTNALGYTPAGTNVYYQATGDTASDSSADGEIRLVPLTTSGAKHSGSGLGVSYYGIKVSNAGTYKITASVYMQAPNNSHSYGVYLMKQNNTPMGDDATEIAGVLYSKPTTTTISTAAMMAPKLFTLAANDVVFLCGRVRGSGGIMYGTNNMTYLLVEKVG